MTLEPLDSPTLRRVGSHKLDRHAFTAKYIQVQKHYIAGYARDATSKPNSASMGSQDSELAPFKQKALEPGFATPVLKPRAPKRHDKEHIKPDKPVVCLPSTKHASAAPSVETQGKSTRAKTAEDVTQKEHAVATSKVGTRCNNKRRSGTDSDEEHAARLAERRERKRAKRVIVRPQEPASDSADPVQDAEECANEDTTKGSKPRGKGKATKKAKASAGHALMNAFFAKNVSKNRLTLKPEAQTGVFSKGRASAKTVVTNKKTKALSEERNKKVFSEARFLNSGKPPAQLSYTSSDSESSSEDGSAPSDDTSLILRKNITSAPVGPARPDRTNEKVVDTQATDDQTNTTVSRKLNLSQQPQVKEAVSEIWDIEVDGRSLPSEVSSVALGSHVQEGTVLLNMPAFHLDSEGGEDSFAQSGSAPKATFVQARSGTNIVKTRESGTGLATRSSSIGPSESASQFRPEMPNTTTFSGAFSRYFPAAVLDAVRPALEKEPYTQTCLVEKCPSPRGGLCAIVSHNEPQDANPVSRIAPCALSSRPNLAAEPSETCSLPLDVELIDRNAYAIPDPSVDHMSMLEVPISPSMSVNSLELALENYEADYVLGAHLYPQHMEILERDYDLRTSPGSEHQDLAHHDVNWGDYYEDDVGAVAPLDIFGSDDVAHNLIEGLADWQYRGSQPTDSLPPESELGDLTHDNLAGHDLDYWSVTNDAATDIEQLMDGPDDIYEYVQNLGAGEHSGDYTMGSDIDVREVLSRPQTPCSETIPASDAMSVSDCAFDQSSLLPLFSEGRSLLLGFTGAPLRTDSITTRSPSRGVSKAEMDVVKSMKHHWLPQRL